MNIASVPVIAEDENSPVVSPSGFADILLAAADLASPNINTTSSTSHPNILEEIQSNGSRKKQRKDIISTEEIEMGEFGANPSRPIAPPTSESAILALPGCTVRRSYTLDVDNTKNVKDFARIMEEYISSGNVFIVFEPNQPELASKAKKKLGTKSHRELMYIYPPKHKFPLSLDPEDQTLPEDNDLGAAVRKRPVPKFKSAPDIACIKNNTNNTNITTAGLENAIPFTKINLKNYIPTDVPFPDFPEFPSRSLSERSDESLFVPLQPRANLLMRQGSAIEFKNALQADGRQDSDISMTDIFSTFQRAETFPAPGTSFPYSVGAAPGLSAAPLDSNEDTANYLVAGNAKPKQKAEVGNIKSKRQYQHRTALVSVVEDPDSHTVPRRLEVGEAGLLDTQELIDTLLEANASIPNNNSSNPLVLLKEEEARRLKKEFISENSGLQERIKRAKDHLREMYLEDDYFNEVFGDELVQSASSGGRKHLLQAIFWYCILVHEMKRKDADYRSKVISMEDFERKYATMLNDERLGVRRGFKKNAQMEAQRLWFACNILRMLLEFLPSEGHDEAVLLILSLTDRSGNRYCTGGDKSYATDCRLRILSTEGGVKGAFVQPSNKQ